MRENLDAIIRKLEAVQELIHRGEISRANTAAYEAQNMVQFLKDNKC